MTLAVISVLRCECAPEALGVDLDQPRSCRTRALFVTARDGIYERVVQICRVDADHAVMRDVNERLSKSDAESVVDIRKYGVPACNGDRPVKLHVDVDGLLRFPGRAKLVTFGKEF